MPQILTDIHGGYYVPINLSKSAAQISERPTGVDTGDSGHGGTPTTPAGTHSLSGTTWTIEGGGNDVFGSDFTCHFVYWRVQGDATAIVEVTSQENTNGAAKAGLMFSSDTDTDAQFVDICLTPSNGVRVQTSDSTSATAANAYTRLKLVRAGNVITGYNSNDGVTWTSVGNRTIALGSVARVGMLVCSHDGATTLSTCTFENFSLTSDKSPTGGVPTEEFIAPVAMTVVSQLSRVRSGSGLKVRPTKNGGTSDGTESAATGQSVVTTTQSLSLSAGDRLGVNITDMGTETRDVTVTYWAKVT